MVLRELKQKEYDALGQVLQEKGRGDEFAASSSLSLTIGEAVFVIRLQLETRRRVAVLQACRIGGNQPLLITENRMLSALLDILLFQSRCPV